MGETIECENCGRRTSKLHRVPGENWMACDDCMGEAMSQLESAIEEQPVNACPEHYRLSMANYNTVAEWYDVLKAHKQSCPFCSLAKGLRIFAQLAEIGTFAETPANMVRGPFSCLMADYSHGETFVWCVEYSDDIAVPVARHYTITRKQPGSVVSNELREVA